MLQELLPLTKQTDKGITIANEAIILLRKSAIVLPSLAVIERLCAEAITVLVIKNFTMISPKRYQRRIEAD